MLYDAKVLPAHYCITVILLAFTIHNIQFIFFQIIENQFNVVIRVLPLVSPKYLQKRRSSVNLMFRIIYYLKTGITFWHQMHKFQNVPLHVTVSSFGWFYLARNRIIFRILARISFHFSRWILNNYLFPSEIRVRMELSLFAVEVPTVYVASPRSTIQYFLLGFLLHFLLCFASLSELLSTTIDKTVKVHSIWIKIIPN